MIQLDEKKQILREVEKKLAEAGASLGIEELKKELASLKQIMEEPDFWNDIENANKISKRAKPIEVKISGYDKLIAQKEDLDVMLELAGEDDDLAEEFAVELDAFSAKVDDFHLSSLLSGPYDMNNAIISLHAGAGGTEAQDWTEMLLRMYTRWAERRGFELKQLDFLEGDEAGVKSVTLLISGLNAYGYMRAEKGVHRLVRISPFDSNARRHTSFASLDVMPEIDDDEEIEINPDDIRVDTYRSSGAGGQHINKTSSAIRITHIPTGIVVQCQNERSQLQNKETAMRMLMSKLVEKREEERLAKMADIQGDLKKIEWGSQIRSYVFHPYSMVKDHRTGYETGNISAVMDGDIDAFINEYLIRS